jgi:predicted DNA binding CopG/RHH family protein
MNARIKYTDEPIEARVIEDFLPPPDQLIFREETVKVTLTLSKKSVDFFKSEAAKNHSQYQRMLRVLIDQYVAHYDTPSATNPKRAPPKR